MSETVYVAVSLRAWRQRDEWAEQRTAGGRWRRVLALGLDDIMSWLSVAPRTELWLAERLGLHPGELELGARWWRHRQDGSGGLFDRSVALAGRGDAAEDLRQRIAEGRAPVVVEAADVDEALEFIAAAAEASDGGQLLDRMVFVRGPNAWQRLLAEEGCEMVLVAADPQLGENLPPTRHTVVIAVQSHDGSVAVRRERDGSRDRVAVRRLDARLVAEALDSDAARLRGIDSYRARELGALGGRSASALRRQLSVDPTIRVPLWARTDSDSSLTRRAKTAALLAGAWVPGQPEGAGTSSDRHVLAHLAGGNLDYETVEIELNAVADGADPMLTVSSTAWRLVSPSEAWELLAERLLTADAVNRFLGAATGVLGERDPLANFHGDEYIAAQLRGMRRAYSRELRRGMARSLALLCARGPDLPLLGGTDTASLARRCVGHLLARLADDGDSTEARVRRLVELGDVLPLLAEAAPDEFVAAVDRTLRCASEASRLWFSDGEDGSGGWGVSSPHTLLLFAVETLAWLPGRLADIADILFRLEILDPGGRLANRPAATFAAIFSTWASQTGIDHRERLNVLEGLRNRLVDHATSNDDVRALVRLVASLIPRSGSMVMSSERPQVRDYRPPSAGLGGDVESPYAHQVVELLLGLVEYRIRELRDAAGLLDVLEAPGRVTTATSLPRWARDRLWALLEEAVSMSFDSEELGALAQRLSELARLHRGYADQPWTLPADETDRIERAVQQIAAARTIPSDLVETHVWLFEEHLPQLGPDVSRTRDRMAYEQALLQRRAAAVGEVMRTDSLGGLYRLAARAEADRGFAPVGIIGAALEQFESQPPNDSGAAPAPLALDDEARLFAALDLATEEAAPLPDAWREVRIASEYFAARFRRLRRVTGDGWGWLSELLHRDGVTAWQQARLVELTRDHPRAWQEAEALGPATLAAYWKLMNWAGLGHDFEHLEDVALGLLSVDRASDAVELFACYNDDASLGPDRRLMLAVRALEALAPTEPARTASGIEAWHITQLLDSLAHRFPLTEGNLDEPIMRRLTQLEMAYLALRGADEPAPFIHDRMSLDPRSFVEVVSIAYRRASHQTQGIDPYAEMSLEQRTQMSAQRMAAYRILRSWQRPPGLDSAGVIDHERLRCWVDVAQRMLDEQDRRDDGDEHIGRVLSAAPPDPSDGVAPPIPVRELLENGQSPRFEGGLGSGLHHGPTGIVGGLVTEMIAESQQAHSQATRDAATVAARWPRTARLLRRVADAHAGEARSWQDDQDPLD